ncbi:alpha amylase family protein [Carboxylicivirga taeanensis]|uniref:alpha amylase family protein n=1 Tax=Carboxylicivirga taeanensis TaxID=1416875 RepID=UPI003F6DFE9E
MRFKQAFKPFVLTLCLMSFFSLSSCKDDDNEVTWEWDDEEVANIDKPKVIWVDAAANFPDFANSKENILRDLKLAKEAGFTHVVVDVRPTTGDVLFKTDVVDQVKWLGAWLPEGYSKIERTATWDYLDAFIETGHSLGLKIFAGINTFSGGNATSLGGEGLLFRDATKKSWATELLTESGIINTLDKGGSGSKFFNPVNEEVQNFLLQLVEDLAAYENLDGIILDRGRFDEFGSDFSDYTKAKFEQFLGHQVANFPNDVMVPGTKPGNLPSTLPVYFKQWLEFRAKVIHDFMESARNRVKGVNPDIQFGVYVGGWYSVYYGVGVNWASPDYNTSAYYSQWASKNYQTYGYADHMDVMLIGAYAAPTKVYGSNEWTIQGFCQQAKDKIRKDAVVIGGPDIGNGAWATESDATINSAITQSVDAAINACDGYFLFDMIHLKLKNQWPYVKEGIDEAISTEK